MLQRRFSPTVLTRRHEIGIRLEMETYPDIGLDPDDKNLKQMQEAVRQSELRFNAEAVVDRHAQFPAIRMALQLSNAQRAGQFTGAVRPHP